MSDQVIALNMSALPATLRLPPEVLCVVFEMLARITPLFDSYTSPTSAGRLAWLNATHVCRSWRDTAIAHKRLWAHITNTHPELFKMFAERSGHVALSVFGESAPGLTISQSYMFVLIENLGRIKSLSILAEDFEYGHLDFLYQLLQAFASVRKMLPLETLRLSLAGFRRLPENLFSYSPNLCDVFLTDVAFHVPVISHYGMRSLHICDFKIYVLRDIYNILTLLPNIESVVLENAWDPDDLDIDDSYGPVISLPHLRTLTLKNTFLSSACLLKYLQMHPQVYVELGHSEITVPPPWDNAAFMNQLRLHFERHPLPTAVSVHVNSVTINNSSGLEVFKVDTSFHADREVETKIHLPTRTLYATPGFRIYADMLVPALQQPDGSSADPVLRLLSSLMFCSASWTSLTLHGGKFWYSKQFLAVLSGAANVQNITLREIPEGNVLYFFSHLNPRTIHLHSDLPDLILLQKLHTITLEGIEFQCPHSTCQGTSILLEGVEHILYDRKAAGYPIKDIILRDCVGVIESWHVKQWGEQGGCAVHWDGKGRAEHGHEEDFERLIRATDS